MCCEAINSGNIGAGMFGQVSQAMADLDSPLKGQPKCCSIGRLIRRPSSSYKGWTWRLVLVLEIIIL